MNTVNAGGHTPLHETAYRGFDQILMELLKNGAKPNAISNQKRTPLHEACIQGTYEMCCYYDLHLTLKR